MKTVLFPFNNKETFQAGFIWSLQLATKLKGQLSLFTALPEKPEANASSIYNDLIEARDSYIRAVGIFPGTKKPHPVVRNFVKGDFLATFLHFVEEYRYDVLVLPSSLLPGRILNNFVNSHKHVIALAPTRGHSPDPDISSTDNHFFVETLHRSACYNLPTSFYRSVSEDKSLFNPIGALFRRNKGFGKRT